MCVLHVCCCIYVLSYQESLFWNDVSTSCIVCNGARYSSGMNCLCIALKLYCGYPIFFSATAIRVPCALSTLATRSAFAVVPTVSLDDPPCNLLVLLHWQS
jgi:hypothetical protein